MSIHLSFRVIEFALRSDQFDLRLLSFSEFFVALF